MFTVSQIADILNTVATSRERPDVVIDEIVTDSRQITTGEQALFIALSGKRTDGHLFVRQAWEKGVRNFVVGAPGMALPLSNVFVVADTLSALQDLARAYRGRFDIPCIGITGSNGKTWVKEWLAQLLSPDHMIVRSPRSYNSQVGVPLSIFRLRDYHTLAIFEAGLSEPDEMAKIASIIRPTIGVFTHFGDAHNAGFSSDDQKLKEKCQLFEHVDVLLCAGTDKEIVERIRARLPEVKVVSWSTNGDADLRVSDVQRSPGNTHINYHMNGRTVQLSLPFLDEASQRNALTCCLVLEHFGYAPDVIAERMARLQPLNMRLEVHRLPNQCLLINDTYSLDMASLQVGLETLEQHSAGMQRAVIITDIDQQRKEAYREIAELLIKRKVSQVFTIGDTSQTIGQFTPAGVHHAHFQNVTTFIASGVWRASSNTAFLLKGARRFQLEKAVRHMQARLHSAVLEIDLNAMLANLQFFRSRLHPGTRLIAMVKAAAYGSGGIEVARFLEFNNVDMLGVAYVDEGVELRRAGVALPILVMNPDSGTIERMIESDLQPEVYDLNMLREFAGHAQSHDRPLQVHLKVETGMHRLGFTSDAVEDILDVLKNYPMIKVDSVFTHLSAAGSKDHDAFTHQQCDRFSEFYERLAAGLPSRPYRHVLNTDGILHFPQYQFEAVRLGIGLYGADTGDTSRSLEPVHRLKAHISQIHQILPGESVGYGRSFVAESPMRIATVNIGYADGVMRKAGNQRFAMRVQDREAPILGNVCMDMCMLDITDFEDVAVGDVVEVFGARGSLERLAIACETIPYEILTSISPRVPRIFKFA